MTQGGLSRPKTILGRYFLLGTSEDVIDECNNQVPNLSYQETGDWELGPGSLDKDDPYPSLRIWTVKNDFPLVSVRWVTKR